MNEPLPSGSPPDGSASISLSDAWGALRQHALGDDIGGLRDLFASEPERVDALTLTAGDLRLDFSKHLITARTLELLEQLVNEAHVADRREAMFRGDIINTTEDRPVLHTALRAARGEQVLVDGHNVVDDVHEVLDRMKDFANRVHSGEWTGATGEPISTVVNLGIGGSDLGPLMVHQALRSFATSGVSARFVSNVDPADLIEATQDLDPATTLFIVASKSFTTVETMRNADAAREWLVSALGADAVRNHFVALSTNVDGVTNFGIDPENMFEFWDWVGGRYSVDSAIGLSVMLTIGPKHFLDLLAGFRVMDEHFRSAPFASNAPMLAAAIGLWYRNFLGFATHAVLPYSDYLGRLPSYLQQLDMESNGKRVRHDGTPVEYVTGPIIWGEPGTNGQHAFYQLLHQGTTVIPADFIGFINPVQDLGAQHELLMANMFAQAEALAFGQTEEEVAAAGVEPDLVPHRTFPGNRPSTTILASRLTPSVLGQLIAFYEHKVFVQGAIWGINSFDQWGVQLGKVLATRINDELADDASGEPDHDRSTNALIAAYRSGRVRQ